MAKPWRLKERNLKWIRRENSGVRIASTPGNFLSGPAGRRAVPLVKAAKFAGQRRIEDLTGDEGAPKEEVAAETSQNSDPGEKPSKYADFLKIKLNEEGESV